MAITIGLMMTSLAGLVGLSVDIGDWYATRRAMQSAVDAAALGGALQIFEGNTSAQATAAANTDGSLNKTGLVSGATLTVAVDMANQVVTATMTKTADLLLAGLFLGSAPTITVSAKAGMVNGGTPACLLTTSTTGTGLALTGNGSISASGCGIVVDSTSSSAITTTGNATVTSKALCGPGGYTGTGYNPAPSSCIAMTDPLYNWPAPSTVNDPCGYNNTSVGGNGATTLSPGVYCGGISVGANATANFQPGIYILRNGALTGTGNAVINGTGVSFYMTGTGTAVQLENDDISITGNVTVNVTAPTSGTMAGIAIYQDHSAPTGDISNKLAGNGTINFTGVLYFGNQNLTISGNGTQDGQAAFTAFIANTLTYTGNGSLVLNANYSNTSVPLPAGLAFPVVALIQ